MSEENKEYKINIVYNPPCQCCGAEHENIFHIFCDKCIERVKNGEKVIEYEPRKFKFI